MLLHDVDSSVASFSNKRVQNYPTHLPNTELFFFFLVSSVRNSCKTLLRRVAGIKVIKN